MRFKQFVKGAFLYNTVYWRRASDDLDIQSMSREERASLRPKRNLDIIRPRERARARVNDAVLSLPPEYGERSNPLPVVQISDLSSESESAAPEETGPVEIHRRRKRRRSRHSQVMPKRYYDSSDDHRTGGILGWLFKK